MLDIKRVIASSPKKSTDLALQELTTPWGEHLLQGESEYLLQSESEYLLQGQSEHLLQGKQSDSASSSASLHPHPQFERENFELLDGWWEYCFVPLDDQFEAANTWQTAEAPSQWQGKIRVPFSPEAPLSGVNKQLQANELFWYKKSFACPADIAELSLAAGTRQEDSTLAQNKELDKRCLLHFEAVDYACACYCNGKLVGTHEGAYLPFVFDITELLVPGENELSLCVFDPSDEGVQLRGKQKLARGGIWYTAQSGIWQSVWLEVVPHNHLVSLAIDAKPSTNTVRISAVACGGSLLAKEREALDEEVAAAEARDAKAQGTKTQEIEAPVLSVTLLDEGREVCTGTARQASSSNELMQLTYIIELKVDNPHLWSSNDPHLYDLEVTYGQDKIKSYCAFRTLEMKDDEQGIRRFYLNDELCFLRGVLDQGYWPDGLLTSPSDDALIYDIQAMKDLGFNMLRKHIKIESDRWYYHCDRLGMLVWQDMVCGGSPPKPWHTSYKPTFLRNSWTSNSDGPDRYKDYSAENEDFREEWTQTCAGTIKYLGNHPSIITWVLFNEAWGQFDARKATALAQSLDSTRPIDAVSGWYDQECGDFFSVHNYFRPLEVYKDYARSKRAFVISEFGGLSYHLPEHSSLATSYGYESYNDEQSFREAVQDILATADKLEQQGLAGFVYTQLSDVEEETNGLLTYDRRINKLERKTRDRYENA